MSYKVSVASTDHTFYVDEGETVLQAALRQGVGLPYGCRNGACGRCAGDLISGSVELDEEALRGFALKEHELGRALFCQCRPKSDLEIRVREVSSSGDIEIKTLPCRVEKKQLLTHDIMRIDLKLPETERLQFLAGQYIEFLLKDGKRRAFSIANAPHDDELIELHIKHVPDGQFGDYVFNGLREKELLRISGPFGNYYLREESERPVILIGGGSGFAPLKGMLEHAFHIGLKNRFHLYCGVRARRDLYMDEMVEAWASEHENLLYTPVLSQPMEEDAWDGATGYVHEAVITDHPDLSEFDVYLSGPPPMIKSAMDAFYERGLSEDRIYSDSFEYSDDALKAMGINKPSS